MVKSVIMQPTFIPWAGYFDLIDESDIFVFLDHVQFDYRSWQHKNKIKSSSKKELFLTIPVVDGENKQKLKDVLIHKESNFVKKHLKSIFFNYKKSKYFESFYPEYEKILKKNHTHLVNLNYDLISFICKYLKFDSKFIKSSTLDISEKKDKLILEILEKIKSNNYYTPAGSAGYLNKNTDFVKKKINIFYQEYKCKRYEQLHGDFVQYLSILDTAE